LAWPLNSIVLLCPKDFPLVSCLPNYSSSTGTLLLTVLTEALNMLPDLNNRRFSEQIAKWSALSSLANLLAILSLKVKSSCFYVPHTARGDKRIRASLKEVSAKLTQ